MKEKESKCGTLYIIILCLHGDWSQSLKYTTCGLRRVNDNTHRYVSIFISHIYTHFVKKQHGSGKHKLRAMAQLPRIQPQWLRQRSRPQCGTLDVGNSSSALPPPSVWDVSFSCYKMTVHSACVQTDVSDTGHKRVEKAESNSSYTRRWQKVAWGKMLTSRLIHAEVFMSEA